MSPRGPEIHTSTNLIRDGLLDDAAGIGDSVIAALVDATDQSSGFGVADKPDILVGVQPELLQVGPQNLVVRRTDDARSRS